MVAGVNGLPAKSPIYTEMVLANPLFVEVSNQLLTTRSSSWSGAKEKHYVSLPQLNSTSVLAIGPGARAQDLHRDDILHHTKLPKITADQYTTDRDTALGIFMAASKTTVANGATRFIPGSHLDDSAEGPGNEDEVVYAEMDPGDVFLMLASCFHGGSYLYILSSDSYIVLTSGLKAPPIPRLTRLVYFSPHSCAVVICDRYVVGPAVFQELDTLTSTCRKRINFWQIRLTR
jgi:hypothetical protein